MSEITMRTEDRTGDLIVTLKVSRLDMVRADLTSDDFELLRECDKSKNVSDKLLALETLVRRIEGPSAHDQ